MYHNSKNELRLWDLLAKFFPLAMTDLAMTIGDPLRSIALGNLARPQVSLASTGAVKSIAVFLESSVIMILQSSTALCTNEKSFRSLRTLTLVLSIFLSAFFCVLCYDPVFYFVMEDVLGLNHTVASASHLPLILMVPWPCMIAWRRLYQGKLIRGGNEKLVAAAGVGRLLFVIVVLLLGVRFRWDGAVLASISMIGSVIMEAVLVLFFAKFASQKSKTAIDLTSTQARLPESFSSVFWYYLPLAFSMILLWGGRAMLVALVARSWDASVSLAAWTAAWGLIVTAANGTRMVQQVILAYERQVVIKLMVQFTLVVGLMFCLPICFLGFSQYGESALLSVMNQRQELVQSLIWPLRIGVLFPLLVAITNAYQSSFVAKGKTTYITIASFVGVLACLFTTAVLISLRFPGANSAIVGMVLGQFLEITALFVLRKFL